MTAERLDGDHPPTTISPPNVEAPAVSFCPGFYLLKPEHLFADCDVCGHSGPLGDRCEQLVLPTGGNP